MLILEVFLQTLHHVLGTTVVLIPMAAPAIAVALDIAALVRFVALVLGPAVAANFPMCYGSGAVV